MSFLLASGSSTSTVQLVSVSSTSANGVKSTPSNAGTDAANPGSAATRLVGPGVKFSAKDPKPPTQQGPVVV